MPHSLYGLRLYKISNEIYFSIMTLWKYINFIRRPINQTNQLDIYVVNFPFLVFF